MKHILQNTANWLEFILVKAKKLQQLEKQFKTVISPELAAHCRVANFEKGILIIETDSAVWATQLRYLGPDLLSALRQQPGLHSLRSCKHFINPKVAPPKEAKITYRVPTDTATALTKLAATTSSDKLKSALLKLSKFTKAPPPAE